MNKKEFLSYLEKKLNRFDKKSVDDIVSYYSELITDKMSAENKTEEQVILEFGDLNALIRNISTNMLSTNTKTTSSVNGVTILLGILASPVLLPLFIVVLVFYLVLFILTISLTLSFGAVAVAMPFYAIGGFFALDTLAQKLVTLGVSAIVFAIMFLLAFCIAKYGSKLIAVSTRGIARMLKRRKK